MARSSLSDRKAPAHKTRKSKPPSKVKSNSTIDESKESPLDFAERVKSEELEKLKREAELVPGLTLDEDADVEHLIRTTKALITTTTEIFERCDFYATIYTDSPDYLFGALRVPFFYRVRISTSKHEHELVAYCSKREKCFDLGPGALPSPLIDLKRNSCAGAKNNEAGTLPDYNTLLRSILLHSKEFQIIYLQLLKNHIEAMQVWLGRMDIWIMEQISSYNFLKDFVDGAPKPKELLETLVWNIGSYPISKHGGTHDEAWDLTDGKERKKFLKFYEYLTCEESL